MRIVKNLNSCTAYQKCTETIKPQYFEMGKNNKKLNLKQALFLALQPEYELC